MTDERAIEISKKVFGVKHPSLPERLQIKKYYKDRDPEKGLKTKFKPDESREFNDYNWNKQFRRYQRIENEESKEKISRAASYINSTEYKKIYIKDFHATAVQKRAKEVRYIKDTFDLNFVELAESINKVMGFRRYGPGAVMYIYKNSGKANG